MIQGKENQVSKEILFSLLFLSPVYHELWHSMMSICLFAEVKWQWAMLVLGWLTMHVFDGFTFMLVDANPFWPSFKNFSCTCAGP